MFDTYYNVKPRNMWVGLSLFLCTNACQDYVIPIANARRKISLIVQAPAVMDGNEQSCE
jgi:hypothetical protein